MDQRLGRLLRESRERLGLEQAQVAAHLGVGQQAVSTWELGRSRPRRAMLRDLAHVLGVAEDVLLDAGAYTTAAAARVLPPRSAVLPLASLPPDRFEDLATELLQLLHTEGHASRFGGPGEKQHGIDVLVAGSDGHNLATGQCKRHLQFGAVAVRGAVHAATIEADRHYLFLSRNTASPGARQEIGKYPDWELWDGEDISRYTRSLPLDRAVRIVDTYFPGHREAFLGVRRTGPWLLPEDHFAQGRGQLVSHDWSLVGRADLVDRLAPTLYGSAGRVAVIVGRGGTGKTRLLRAVAEAAPDNDTQVLVLPGGVEVEPEAFELLVGERSLVILVDDAHERNDLNYVISGIWRQNARANILIATRPYRWDAIRSDLSRNPLAPEEPLSFLLADLSSAEAEALARQALGEMSHEAVVHRLARLTRDCPLVTVVGGVLIRRGQLDPGLVGQDDQVRQLILRGFHNALVADPMVVDPDVRSAVLDAVAALQPFRTDDDAFRTAISTLIGRPFDVVNKHLRSLEDAGILRRRGASLRIVPDLLGDVVLTDACYDDRTLLPTGYLDRVRSVTDGQALQHLFVNVSRVDWQIRQKEPAIPSLVDSLWEPLEAELRGADIPGRQKLIRLLARVAYFQPARVIKIARWLIDNPTDEVADSHSAWVYLNKPSYQDVRNAMPPMLKAAAYNLETLPEALNLLWELAQNEARSTNQHPDHAVRIIKDLAAYEIGKPPAYNDAVVDVASAWCAGTTQHLSPFDVLEPLLATEGTRQTYQEYTLTFQPFPLNVDVVNPIRQRVLALAMQEVRTEEVRRAVAGIQCLESSLRYPTGMHGRPVSSEERDRWTPGFVDTIQQLGTIAAEVDLDPVVLVAMRTALNWHAAYSKSATQPVAEAVIRSVRSDLPDRVALILHDGWGHLMYDREHDYDRPQERIRRRLQDAVSDLAALPDDDVLDLITERLSKERMAFGPNKAHPGPLISELVKARPWLAARFVDLTLSGDEPALEPILPVVLATEAELDADAAISRAHGLIAREDPAISLAVAQSIGWNRGRRPLAEGERELLLSFAIHPDPAVRQAPAVVAQRLAEEDPVAACELAAAVDFSDNPRLADEVFMCFAKPFGLDWEMLTKVQVAIIRDRLVALSDIDQHSITELLAERSSVEPGWVIDLLQDRVAFGEGLENLGDYRPMPFHWGNRLRVREHEDFNTHLRRLHAWVAAAPDSWIRREAGSELFREVARPYDDAVLAVLEDALESTNLADIDAVAAVLHKADRTFIWDFPDFVRTALHAAGRFGQGCRDGMASALWGATIAGTRMGTPGQPFREDVEQRDRSSDTAAKMPRGSVEETFYRDVAASAERAIARSQGDDMPDDGRDW